MPKILSRFAMSLDGFVADPDDQVGTLFDWYFNGEVEVDYPGCPPFRMSQASARTWRDMADPGGAMVCGRRVFDFTGGWGGTPPGGGPAFVVTHRPPPENWPPRPDAPFTFVTDGVESAVRQALAVADGRDVRVTGANVVQQCLRLGLLDEVWIDLVPVLFGTGVRYFGDPGEAKVELETVDVVEGWA